MDYLSYDDYRGNKAKVGEYFGYPKCCIRQFMEVYNIPANKTKYAICYTVSTNTGFIPCMEHAKQIMCKEIKLADLINDRKCDAKFPHQRDALLIQFRKQLRQEILHRSR